MIHKIAADLPGFTASDDCILSEVIHPVSDRTSPGVSLARATLPPGQATTPHGLDFLEIYYFLSGKGVMHSGSETCEVGPESCVYLEPGSIQWVENVDPHNDLVFLCVCHPAWNQEGDHPAEAEGR